MSDAGWIVPENLRQLAADRYHRGYKPEVIQPVEAVVYHYTGPGRESGIRRWLTEEDDTFVSAHFVVDRSGTCWQLVPLSERACHGGGPSSTLFGRGNVNGRTIGIEIANVGPVQRGAGGAWQDATGRSFAGQLFDAGEVSRGKSRFWEAYAPAQIDSVVELTRQLATMFPVLRREPEKRLVGHEDVDPTRKTDPGPAFPWSLVREAAEGDRWASSKV